MVGIALDLMGADHSFPSQPASQGVLLLPQFFFFPPLMTAAEGEPYVDAQGKASVLSSKKRRGLALRHE